MFFSGEEKKEEVQIPPVCFIFPAGKETEEEEEEEEEEKEKVCGEKNLNKVHCLLSAEFCVFTPENK